MEVIYTVYQTTNTINGKIYVGVHKTTDPNDSYLGSGKTLKAAIRKYGSKAFKKEILHTFETPEEAYLAESKIVDESFVSRKDTYNEVCGGAVSPDWDENRKLRFADRFRGENHPMWGKTHTAESNERRRQKLLGKKRSQEVIDKCSDSRRGKPSPLKGRPQTAESNQKRSVSHKNMEKVVCPQCRKSVSPQNATRWHMEKCKPRRPRYAKDRRAVGWVEQVAPSSDVPPS